MKFLPTINEFADDHKPTSHLIGRSILQIETRVNRDPYTGAYDTIYTNVADLGHADQAKLAECTRTDYPSRQSKQYCTVSFTFDYKFCSPFFRDRYLNEVCYADSDCMSGHSCKGGQCKTSLGDPCSLKQHFFFIFKKQFDVSRDANYGQNL